MNARRWWDLIVTGSLLVLAVITIDGYGAGPAEREQWTVGTDAVTPRA